MRAIRARYNPYLQTRNRVEQVNFCLDIETTQTLFFVSHFRTDRYDAFVSERKFWSFGQKDVEKHLHQQNCLEVKDENTLVEIRSQYTYFTDISLRDFTAGVLQLKIEQN